MFDLKQKKNTKTKNREKKKKTRREGKEKPHTPTIPLDLPKSLAAGNKKKTSESESVKGKIGEKLGSLSLLGAGGEAEPSSEATQRALFLREM